MSVGIDIDRDRLVAGVHDGHLLGRLLLGDRRTFVKQRNAGIVKPTAKHPFERVLAPSEIFGQGLFVLRGRALEGDLVALVAVVDVCHVAFLGELDSLLVGKFAEAPVKHA